jgi:hypothetical protein
VEVQKRIACSQHRPMTKYPRFDMKILYSSEDYLRVSIIFTETFVLIDNRLRDSHIREPGVGLSRKVAHFYLVLDRFHTTGEEVPGYFDAEEMVRLLLESETRRRVRFVVPSDAEASEAAVSPDNAKHVW